MQDPGFKIWDPEKSIFIKAEPKTLHLKLDRNAKNYFERPVQIIES